MIIVIEIEIEISKRRDSNNDENALVSFLDSKNTKKIPGHRPSSCRFRHCGFLTFPHAWRRTCRRVDWWWSTMSQSAEMAEGTRLKLLGKKTSNSS